MENEKMRLQKAMSQLGLCSRRQAETLIDEHKVKVNGRIVEEKGVLVSLNDKIEIIGNENIAKKKLVQRKLLSYLINL